jgi:hypothetical protein
MKLKDIAKLCAKTHSIGISEVNGTQWLGNGYAAYPVFNLPPLDEDTAPAVLDFDEEKAKTLDVRYVDLQSKFDLREDNDDEEALTAVLLRFLHKGETLDACQTESGRIVLVDPTYIKPYIADESSVPVLYLRHGEHGDYIVGKSGMFVTAMIMPRELDAKEADSLLRKFNRLALTMEEIAEPAVPVDPNTGEVRDDG